MTVKIDEKAGTLTITLPLTPPRPSSTGKTNIVASTGGSFKTGQNVGGKPLTVSVNAYTPKD
jgi:hypothetical protein